MCASNVLEKAKSLRANGVINYLGFSSHYAQGKEIEAALDTGVFDVAELPYNIFNTLREYMSVETAIGEKLAQRERERLTAEAGKVAPHMKNICRECMHCLEKFECPNGVPFPEILLVYSRYLVNEKLERDTTRFRELFRERGFRADECIECGECVPWCEYKLIIPDMLKQAQQILGQS